VQLSVAYSSVFAIITASKQSSFPLNQKGYIMLNKLTEALDSAVQQIGGIDAAMEACDRMYSATFRSEESKLSSYDDWEDELFALKLEVASVLYSKATGHVNPMEGYNPYSYMDEGDSDSIMYASEAFDDQAESWFDKNYPEFEITGDTLVVDHCNYKGEGEGGLHLYGLHKHLPIFKSKNESFYQVN